MRFTVWHNILGILLFLFGSYNSLAQEATFIPNEGQWSGQFDYKTNLSNGASFFDKGGFYTLLIPGDGHHHNHDHHGHGDLTPEVLEQDIERGRLLSIN